MKLHDQLLNISCQSDNNINLSLTHLHADLVHVFSDQIKEEEVSKLLEIVEAGLIENIRDLVPGHSAGPGLDHGRPDAGPEEDPEAVEEEHTGDGGEEDEPEPEENVDLLVNDVERENTQTVMTLHSSRGSKLVKTAFCNLREDNSKRINSLLQIHF